MRQTRREWAWRRSGQSSKELAAGTGINARTLVWSSTKLRRERAVAPAADHTQRPGAAEALAGRADAAAVL
ncbi:hypothetical protein KF840_09465 [bacterium]|nr:hypothetical protein [bacterium]